MTLSGATTPGQSGPGSDGNEGVLHIAPSSSLTGASPSDCLMSYPERSLRWGSYPSAETQCISRPQLTELDDRSDSIYLSNPNAIIRM